ncbi:MAG: CPBP family intramembrane metalloprotease [Thermoplasmata archaeon]|nr:CPBP family intramembrane metalloprotease [Thermoplasmata archaeon]
MEVSQLETPSPEGGYGTALGGLERYVAAVALTVFAILSQYFLPQLIPALRPVYRDALGDLLVVYGVPIASFLGLVGFGPLRRAFAHPVPALVQGLRWYGALSILSLGVVLALAVIYQVLDPGAIRFLERPNPALQSAASDPWFWVAFSFVIGLVEEVIFRGWVFGYWLAKGTRSWEVHAVWTSAMFAGVHAYYGITYGPVSPIPYSELFLLGLAFACIVRYSGGNLVVPALLHGAHDATAFLTLLNPEVANALQWGLILIGGLVALVYALLSREAPPAIPAGAAPRFAPDDPYSFLATGRMGEPTALNPPMFPIPIPSVPPEPPPPPPPPPG